MTKRSDAAIRIVLAESQALMRQGLRRLLEADPALAILGEAGDGLAALEMTRRLGPDVLVLDLALPFLGGFDVAREATRDGSPTRVVAISTHDDEEQVRKAFLNGASGYVLKSGGATDLLTAIHEVAAGNRYVSAPLFTLVARLRRDQRRRAPVDPYDSLTLRQREVLRMVLEGLSNAAIARRLSISARTAETHCAHVMRKLGIHRRVDLLRYAVRRGLMPSE